MAGNYPYFPKLAFKKPGKIIYEKITSAGWSFYTPGRASQARQVEG